MKRIYFNKKIVKHNNPDLSSAKWKQPSKFSTFQNLNGFFLFLIIICLLIQSSFAIQVPASGGADQIVPAMSNVPDIQPGHQAVIPSGPQYTIPSKIPVGVSPVNSPGVVSGGCPECSSPAEVAPDNQTISLETLSVSDEQTKIDAINDYIQENDLDWVAGKTSISNLTDEAFQQMLGTKPPEDGVISIQSQPLPELSIESLPDNFSWRSVNGYDWTTPVRDQGQCGSCWAFGGVAVFESFWERLTLNAGLNPDFSEQYIVSCNTNGWSCRGGWIPFDYFINRAGTNGGVGIYLESVYPYTATSASCQSPAGTRYSAPPGTAWYYVYGLSVPSVNQLKTALVTYGPLEVALASNDGYFSAYRGGYYSSSYNGDIDHSVMMYGWETYQGQTYWLCKNSWNTWWGEQGYFKILAGSNKIGFGAAYLTAPLVPAPTVSSITPAQAKQGTTVSVTNLAGTGFGYTPSVVLRRSGYPDIAATQEVRVSATQLTCTIDLTGAAIGTWDVVVTNPDGQSGTKAGLFTVQSPLMAKFYGVPDISVSPYTVSFFDVSEGSVLSRVWNFGDGNTTGEANPSHTYYEPDTYTVTLQVTDGVGTNASVLEIQGGNN